MLFYNLQHFCQSLPAGKARLFAFMCGLLSALAMPPVELFPVLLLTIPVLVWLSQHCDSKKQALLVGWLFGAGYFIAGLYWISIALFVDIANFWWVLPFSGLVGPALLGVFIALPVLFVHILKLKNVAHTVTLLCALAAMEWVRGHIFTGFPWNLTGYAWGHVLSVLQSTSVYGIYGLSLITFFWAAIPVFWLSHRKFSLLLIASFILVCTAGFWRLSQPTDFHEDQNILLVQPNISQTLKWDAEEHWRNLEKHMTMTSAGATEKTTAVIWPETAVTGDLALHPQISGIIADHLPQNSLGILGSLRITPNTNGEDKFHNSITVLDTKGRVVDTYHKFHLVPFGEYIPFRNILNITPIALTIANIGDFTPGDGNRTIKTDSLPPFSPLICYEIIFPTAVIDKEDRPKWIVNVTNDGWYGNSAGPYQHFATAKVRAIEEGLPVARVANTGISGMIDAHGRIIEKLPYGVSGVANSPLPKSLPPTLYFTYGNTIFWGMVIFGFLYAFYTTKRS